MPIAFSSEDLGRVFPSRTLTRGRTLVLAGAVEVHLDGDAIAGSVQERGTRHAVRIVPSALGRRVVFDAGCGCGAAACVHLAAAAFAALDRFPALRRPEQQSFFDALVASPVKEKQKVVFELAAGLPPHACFVSVILVGERTGRIERTTPAQLLADAGIGGDVHALATALGGGDQTRTGIPPGRVAGLLPRLAQSGLARWQATARALVSGETRNFVAGAPPPLPPRSAVIAGDAGSWYVDAATGAVGRIHLQQVRPRPVPGRVVPDRPARRVAPSASVEPVIVERAFAPVLRLTRLECPDEGGRLQVFDALLVDFEYDGIRVHADDDRQFLRVEAPGGPVFVRRDRAAEASWLEALLQDGFVQMRVADGAAAKGRRAFLFRGRDAVERWQAFVTERVPALQALGWRSLIDRDFGPRVVGSVGICDMRVADAAQGGFSLDLGIEIEGVRHKLLPILMRLHERGGMEAAQIVDGEVVTSLDDGRILKLPAERIGRLLAVIGDLIEAARRTGDDALVLDAAEAPAVLDLEELLTARWQDAAAIAARVAHFRGVAEIPEVAVPAGFTAVLRPYQQQGVNWLQHLRACDLSGFLADDMGLGKTAQTIAHIVVEEAAGRLDRPTLIVVPTSLVSNWTAELAKFAPHLRVAVLHGLDRHERRDHLDGIHVVVTTYTVLARDIDAMQHLSWHLVVLDEAQAIKNPAAKATHAVCRLDTRHRLCLSGTPIENNLGELWSQFAFLMPGLLGERKTFSKRFRTPIEKKGDVVRRRQLARRIRPFILRRTKAEVAAELPPKHTILRRITLAPDQRELYETIRATLHEKVHHDIATRSLAQSRIVVLDALLKLRQVCCDPRLVKLPSAQFGATSSKLDDLLEMVTEMVSEGRRILLFSQFTSMLDLIRPRLAAAGIAFVELRGDTDDRATPVRRFEAGEVPVFLISLKAGGRGLNLTSADTVIHYDPWWNPAVEDQASDRAHRIGQTKSVFVYKLIAADTVEERILDLQERKAALAGIAFDTEVAALPGLEFEDIDFLFGPATDPLAA
ncbi:DEAD/DEAH box helicase [Rhodovastum atsumiense]|uniref:DEAD/DEAH box helicase n=1 Tax=Rhodovastum atsumiense TaxID=504468 RepID=A0A5M6IT06_9PROT|nr:DEAD/DEAH box helicase [Rhodovastum atsumiense]KAA5611456.1 DEAD/DEAH box helicase [Rhodovastum atsumiense]CAH2601140.1 DEAD/DEAH box helicase [Rhodovastum atsumiense]